MYMCMGATLLVCAYVSICVVYLPEVAAPKPIETIVPVPTVVAPTPAETSSLSGSGLASLSGLPDLLSQAKGD